MVLCPIDVKYRFHQLLLYRLLDERYKHAESVNTIWSLESLPTFDEYVKWLATQDVSRWYLCFESDECIGSVFLRPHPHGSEIGVFVFEQFQRQGFGKMAVQAIREKHPGPIVAIINPRNEASKSLFAKVGFREVETVWVCE